jgi:TfoX/Sxy family transcriptional regulator of competence genes
MTTTKKSKPMPKWRPSPPELVKMFEKSLKPFSEIQTRKMFGYPVAFVNSHMFAGLHQDNMILRLSGDDRTGFLQQDGAKIFEPLPGRFMREYVVVPASMLRSAKPLDAWLRKAWAYARSLPPKAATSRSEKGKASPAFSGG